ncbi:MAG: class I SAM-dependent methyltransferase [Hyphomonadaceae bacterium]|nr:class I SAM-dependent methyltransferase [Hyphomonadaceae bacterium]
MDRRIVGRLYRRIVHKYFVNDLMLELRLRARRETADYIAAHLKDAMLFADRYALLDHALAAAKAANPTGLVCEFGVAGGKTLRHIGQAWPGPVHGFDSFEGLPEDWTGTAERAGRFHARGKLPKTTPNATLHVGWFDQTVPPFLAQNAGPAALLHLDADLYSSTKTVLTLFKDRIGPGAVIVFDEYDNYPNWREHEFKAFQEFVAETGKSYKYIGFSTLQGQAAVQIVG